MGCGIRRSYPVPRISTPENAFPRTRVNKGKKAQTGHGRMLMKALKEVPSIEPAGAGKTALEGVMNFSPYTIASGHGYSKTIPQ
jgi:ribosomal protein L34E